MLTVKEINEVSFGKAGFSGYKPEDVDNFIDEVVVSFQQLEAERDDSLKRAGELSAQNADLTAKNSELQEKLSILANEIESYRADEEGIKEALLSAQRIAKDSVQDAKDKAAVILQDAQDSARQILDDARAEASKAAKEYEDQTNEKREEFEEMKRQVTAFRSSLLDMYKKHLESINQIPNFHVKRKIPETPVTTETAESVEQSEISKPEPIVNGSVSEPSAEKAVDGKSNSQPINSSHPQPQPRPRKRPNAENREQPSLHDKVDFTKSVPVEDDFADEDLTSVGIDIRSYNNIPETLKREKNNHFNNLEFGDDVDLGNKKRRK